MNFLYYIRKVSLQYEAICYFKGISVLDKQIMYVPFLYSHFFLLTIVFRLWTSKLDLWSTTLSSEASSVLSFFL